MCRWLGYIGSAIYLDSLIFEPKYSLIQQSLAARKSNTVTQGDGFGVGWYGNHLEPGLYREVLPAWNDRNLRSLARHVQSPLFFAHVRASTGSDTARSNCHPFSYKNWLFVHNGVIGGYDRLRRRLEAYIPDELYTNRSGTTDSENAFFHILKHNPENDPIGAISAAISEIRSEQKLAKIDEPLRFTSALSDGRRIIAIRYASDNEPPSLYWRQERNQLVVVSEPLDDGSAASWKRVPPNHFLISSIGSDVELHPVSDYRL
jgi:predicted glutamine amidotransferase